jgi:hypothetical protein
MPDDRRADEAGAAGHEDDGVLELHEFSRSASPRGVLIQPSGDVNISAKNTPGRPALDNAARCVYRSIAALSRIHDMT